MSFTCVHVQESRSETIGTIVTIFSFCNNVAQRIKMLNIKWWVIKQIWIIISFRIQLGKT